MTICTHIYPTDSIEYFFPAWSIQTWDYGGHSLLGRGIHHEILKQLNDYRDKYGYFDKEVMEFKQMILDDISQADVSYWEGQPDILKELNVIIKSDFSLLSNEDKIALEVRKGQFLEPERFKIELNLRSGE
jgi:hypothetical protein